METFETSVPSDGLIENGTEVFYRPAFLSLPLKPVLQIDQEHRRRPQDEEIGDQR